MGPSESRPKPIVKSKCHKSCLDRLISRFNPESIVDEISSGVAKSSDSKSTILSRKLRLISGIVDRERQISGYSLLIASVGLILAIIENEMCWNGFYDKVSPFLTSHI